MASRANEVVFFPMEETPGGHISGKNLPKLLELASRVDMVVMGPGLGVSEDGQRLVTEILARVELPVLVDGDGLTLLARSMDVLKGRKAPTILTPHPGEMQRLSGRSIGELSEDPIGELRSFAKEWNSYLVYKVARSILVAPDGRVFINPTGNSGMGTAGSGDCLTGAIAAQYCLTRDVLSAIRNGVFLHGMGGDLAALEKGEDGITANDILEHLPLAVKLVRTDKVPGLLMDRYQIPKVL
jgi:NAD(P)H-hydrate epimerase